MRIVRASLNNNKVGELFLSGIKTNYKAIIRKTVRQKDRQIDPGDKIKSLEIDSHKYKVGSHK